MQRRDHNAWLRLRGSVDQLLRMDRSQLQGWLGERRRLETPQGLWQQDDRVLSRLASLFPGLRDLATSRTGQLDSELTEPAATAVCTKSVATEAAHSIERCYDVGQLALAFAASGRRQLLEQGATRIDAWIAGPAGPHAWSPMNISERVVQWALLAATGTEYLDRSRQFAWLASMHTQLLNLEGRLEYRAGNNHLLFNARALLLGAAVFEPTVEHGMGATGAQLLSTQLKAQFGEDGAHLESCAGYHLWVMQCLWECAVLTRQLQGASSLALAIDQVLAKASHVLSLLTNADGTVVQLGDCKDQDIAAMPSDMVALLGYRQPSGWARLWRVSGGSPGHRPSRGYSSGDVAAVDHISSIGLHIVRSTDDTRLVFKTGPLSAFSKNPGHGHADVLSFVLDVAGRPLFVDSGTATYEEGAERQYCRSTRAHNTVDWGQVDQALLWRAFRAAFLPRVEPVRCETFGKELVLTGAYSIRVPGTMRASRHARTITWTASGLRIDDEVLATAECRPVWRFIMDPSWQTTPAGDGVCLRWTGETRDGVSMAASVRSGESWEPVQLSTEDVTVWPSYEQPIQTTALRFELPAKAGIRVQTQVWIKIG